MLEHRRGLELKTERAKRAGLKSADFKLPARSPRSYRRSGGTALCCMERSMTNQTQIDPEAWKYAKEAMSWYGWGSPIGLGLFIVAIGAFIALLHVAEVIR
jgi:hypothetical protein